MSLNEYRTASKLYALVKRLEAGEELSVDRIREIEGCQKSTAINRLNWLKEELAGRLEPTGENGGGGWRLKRTDKVERLTAMASEFAATALRPFRETRVHRSLDQLRERLRNGTDLADYDFLSRVASIFVRYGPAEPAASRPRVLDDLLDAIVDCHGLSFDYEPLRGGKTAYVVEPYLIVEYRGGLYLYGSKSDGASACLISMASEA